MPIFNQKVQNAVARAAVLNRAIKEAQEELVGLKELIRTQAEKVAEKRGDNEKVEFESTEGVATVCFPKDSASLVKGANPTALKSSLPETVWKSLFLEKVVLNKEFDDSFELLSKTEKSMVKKLVVWSPETPRVTLPK